METIKNLTWAAVQSAAMSLARRIEMDGFPNVDAEARVVRAYPIPNGGIFAALALQRELICRPRPILLKLVERLDDPDIDIYVDDLIDSGKTLRAYQARRLLPFYALIDKTKAEVPVWVSFPWERMQKHEGPEDNIVRVLQFIGEDPTREGLVQTPARVVRSFAELYGGYKQDPASVLTVFEDGACDEMVILRGCEFYSTCEHHLQPFMGRAHVGYLPDKKVIGISKLARLVDIFARRLQIQERLTTQIAEAIEEHLKPRGVGVVLEAKHLCMVCRGVRKQNSEMVTSALRGAFRESACRAEFFSFVKE